MRATYHLAVLALLVATTVGGFGSQSESRAATAASAAPSPTPAGAVIAPSLTSPLSLGGASGGDTQAAQAAGQAAPEASVARPMPTRRWVQNFRPTELFDGPAATARSLGTAAQFSTFELVEDQPGGRAKLMDHGQGVGRLPGTVWANPADLGPAGPPSPEFELAAGGTVNPVTGKVAPTRIGSVWPRLPSAEAAVVIDGDSGAVLYGKNAHARHAPASLTKILTAIVALERGKIADRVQTNVDITTMSDSTLMFLDPGEVLSLEALLYGLMLPSGNDAALAIARHIGGDEASFARLMNERARLVDSQFRNPHGLDEDGHYSTPYDLAMLARYGMQDPTFYSLSSTQVWRGEGYILRNLNGLLGNYDGADGVKVGFTDNAGRCLVASATRNGKRVFVTVIRSYNPAADSMMLLDYAFQNFKW
jgi:hypothetical protein